MSVVIQSGAVDTRQATVLWENKLTAMNYLASSSAAGYPAVNVTSPDTATEWRPTSVPAWVQGDTGGSTICDSVGIASHTIGSSGASIDIQYSPDTATWTTIQTVTPTTDEDLFLIFPETSSRHWAVRVRNAIPTIGVIFIGKRLVFPHAPIDSYTPLHHSRKYTKYFNTSIGGHLISNRVESMGAETEVDIGFVQRSFVEGDFRRFQKHYNQGGTFFYAGSPVNYPLDVGYCTASSDEEIVKVEYIQADKLANLSFGVRAYVGT